MKKLFSFVSLGMSIGMFLGTLIIGVNNTSIAYLISFGTLMIVIAILSK